MGEGLREKKIEGGVRWQYQRRNGGNNAHLILIRNLTIPRLIKTQTYTHIHIHIDYILGRKLFVFRDMKKLTYFLLV